MDSFMGHPMSYWIELNSRVKELKFEDLLEEIATLRGKVSYYESRIDELNTFKNNNK